MAHTDTSRGDVHPAVGHETTDADLRSAERLVGITIVALGVVAAIVWGMFVYLRSEAARTDPRPIPIAQRQGDRVPPLPRLQTTPYGDLQTFRAAEDAALNAYEWVDRDRGVARVPIGRAIDLIAAKGLPRWPAAPPGASPAAGGRAAGAGAAAPGPGSGTGGQGTGAPAAGAARPDAGSRPPQPAPPRR